MDINIMNYTKDYVNLLYLAGRGCYGLEQLSDESLNKKRIFIKNLIDNGHESVLEHGYISILINGCSRSFMAQITRHRLASFSIKSQHFVKHDKFKYKNIEIQDPIILAKYKNIMSLIQQYYNEFIFQYNIPIHVAREILPNACLTNIFMTTNFREWRYIIKLRKTNKNTYEMIEFANLIEIYFRNIIPEVFSDL